MKSASPVLLSLAQLYAQSKAGRTGAGSRDFLVDLKELLAHARCQDGDDLFNAMRQLREWDGSILFLEGPRKDSDIVHQVRFRPADEAKLFELAGLPSPTRRREMLARQFSDAARLPVPEEWRESWQRLCAQLAEAALLGHGLAPFSRDDLPGNKELLELVPRLLTWQRQGDQSLLRFASCVLTGNSKRLGELAAIGPEGRHIGKLGAILHRVTESKLQCLEDVGISQVPRFVLIRGPLRIRLGEEWLDLGLLHGPVRLSETDVQHASDIETRATRCLTVENETTFHELAKLQSGELLVCTSYPGSATLAFLKKLPDTLEFWHFGDSDPEGFDILRDLRQRSGRPFRALHMDWRAGPDDEPLRPSDRRLLERLLTTETLQSEHPILQRILDTGALGNFEQESLGKPTLPNWPFYPNQT